MPRLKQLSLSNLVDIGGIFGIFLAGILSKMYQPHHYVIISALLGSIAVIIIILFSFFLNSQTIEMAHSGQFWPNFPKNYFLSILGQF